MADDVRMEANDLRRLRRAAARVYEATAERDRVIAELLDSGASIAEVARELGISRQALWEREKRASERR